MAGTEKRAVKDGVDGGRLGPLVAAFRLRRVVADGLCGRLTAAQAETVTGRLWGRVPVDSAVHAEIMVRWVLFLAGRSALAETAAAGMADRVSPAALVEVLELVEIAGRDGEAALADAVGSLCQLGCARRVAAVLLHLAATVDAAERRAA